MQITDIPAKTPVVFASSAGADYIRNIPNASQIGITDGRASYTDGFPPLCFIEEEAGGFPPDGRDFNGLLNDLSGWVQWQQAGGPVNWDSSFSASIGGYPSGALVGGTTAGIYYISTVNNNTTNPNTGGAGWSTYDSFLLSNAALTGVSTAPSAPVNSGSTQIANAFYADRAGTNAVAAAQAYANANFLQLSGGTVAGTTNIGNGSTGAALNINGAAGTFRNFRWQSGGLNRFSLSVTSTAEGGANAGSPIVLTAYDDTGASLGSVFAVTRATRVLGFSVSPTVPNLSYADGSTNVVNSNYADALGLGPNTTNHNVTGSRTVYNSSTTPTPIVNGPKGRIVTIFGKTAAGSSTSANIDIVVDGVIVGSCGLPQIGVVVNVQAFVPGGSSYYARMDQIGTFIVGGWTESY